MLRAHLQRLEWASGGRLTPLITCTMALLIVVHLANVLSGQTLFAWGAFFWPAVLDGEVWRMLSGGLLHFNIMHLLLNCLGLGFFGAESQRHLGTLGFALMLLLAVVLGNVMSGLISPSSVVIGFSGAVFAALIAFATLHPKATVIFLIFPMPAWMLACVLIILDLAGFFEGGGRTAYVAHLTGAAVGFLSIWQGSWLRRLMRTPKRLLDAARDNQERANAQEVDRLLEKVSAQGLTSLTNAERAFLARYSKQQRDQ